jgi:hypothetical protein
MTSIIGIDPGKSGGIAITVPIPSAALSPNARRLWHQKCGPVRDARLHAKLLAIDCMNRLKMWTPPRWERAEVQATFYYPTKRRRDADNSASCLKPTLDGFADAGIVANDSGFTHKPVVLLVDKENPRVEITIEPL